MSFFVLRRLNGDHKNCFIWGESFSSLQKKKIKIHCSKIFRMGALIFARSKSSLESSDLEFSDDKELS